MNVVGGVRQQPFDASTRENWEHDIHRNFGYVLESISAALPYLRRGETGGSIVNFTTIEAHRGAAGFAVYAGAKAGLTNFSRALALELGPERIRVNLIAPDTTPSQGNRNAIALPTMPMRSRFRSIDSFERSPPTYRWLIRPCPRTLPTRCCFSPRTCRPTSPGRPCTSTAAPRRHPAFSTGPAAIGWRPVVPATLLHERAFE